jgi:short subunit dehydrogenase-like uncharacterized protein
MPPMKAKRYDLLVFGATSFVGQILTRYLLEEFGTQGKLRWAIAGRSGSKIGRASCRERVSRSV